MENDTLSTRVFCYFYKNSNITFVNLRRFVHLSEKLLFNLEFDKGDR